MKPIIKAIEIIFRVFAFPVWLIVFLITGAKNVIVWTFNYLRYGSVAIIYSKKINPANIVDVFVKTCEMVELMEQKNDCIHQNIDRLKTGKYVCVDCGEIQSKENHSRSDLLLHECYWYLLKHEQSEPGNARKIHLMNRMQRYFLT